MYGISKRGIYHRIPPAILLALLFGACRHTQAPAEKTPTPTPQAAIAKNPLGVPSPILNHPYQGTGVITIINRKEGWVEINHEEIKGLMPPMEMEYWVKSRSLPNNVKVGDRVDFVVVETPKGEYVTQIRKKA